MASSGVSSKPTSDNVKLATSKWQQVIQPLTKKITLLRSQPNTPPLALVLFEWQDFVPTLFGYGRQTVDSILVWVQKELKRSFKHFGHFYLAPNQFMIIIRCPDLSHQQEKIDNFIYQCLTFGATIESMPLCITFKAGVSLINYAANPTQAIDNALIGLFEARSSALSYHTVFSEDSGVIRDGQHQMELAAYLLEAIQNNRLRLAFQPIINSRNGKTDSYEALLRIVTKEGDVISAGPFIPAAENCGFIKLIDHFVLQLVVKELTLDSSVHITMNVSRLTVKDLNWYKYAKELLTEVIASRLTIEITETGSQADLESVVLFADKMKSLGCLVAIDDFGAGYTSFKQLKLINADILKIDGVFIRDIIDNPDSKLFVNTLLNFARAYNLKTVAEYVETGEIAKMLMELGVDYLQGFYFSQALNYRPWIQKDVI